MSENLTKPNEYARQYYSNTILKSAIKLFLRDGFDKTSVERIAKEAGISPATIYRYFPVDRKKGGYETVFSTKKKILSGLFDSLWELINTEVFEKVPKQKTIMEKLNTIISIVIDIYEREPDLGNVVVFNALWTLDVKLYRSEKIAEFKQFAKEFMSEGVLKGEIVEVNFDCFFEFFFCAIEGCLRILGLKERNLLNGYYSVSFTKDDLKKQAMESFKSLYAEDIKKG